MNSRVAGVGIVALLLGSPPQSMAGEESRLVTDPFAYTAIGHLIRANGGKAPRNATELDAALTQMLKAKAANHSPRGFTQLPVAFSAVALDSGLTHPRVLLTSSVHIAPQGSSFARPSNPPGSGGAIGGGNFGGGQFGNLGGGQFGGGWGGGNFGGGQFGGGNIGGGRWGSGSVVATPISPASVIDPNLEGRLFLAVNLTVPYGHETPRLKSVEFISWNSQRLRFDFGIIECGSDAQVRMLDGVKCFSCHKNRGPILGPNPWSNTVADQKVLAAADALHRAPMRPVIPPAPFSPPEDDVPPAFGPLLIKNERKMGPFEGASLTLSQGVDVDGGVRQGADLLHDREMFRLMTRSPDGRKAFVMLLAAIAQPGSLDTIDKELKFKLNASFSAGFPKFIENWTTLQKATPPSMLIDFNPVEGVAPRPGVDPVQYYDMRRAAGEHGLPGERRPSNPKAFVTSPIKTPGQPSVVLSASLLARTIGLTEGDREYFAESLKAAALIQQKSSRELTEVIFNGTSFADVLAGGPLPDREDFKARFVEGLMAPLKRHGYERLGVRPDFASAPVPPPNTKDIVEPVLVPTTRCQGCHDIRGTGKAAGTEPIPALLFDPFDKDGREAWLDAADKQTKVRVLTKLLRRLGEDRDMPPTDSAEFEVFRARDPAAFEAVKVFLEAELRKAKGG